MEESLEEFLGDSFMGESLEKFLGEILEETQEKAHNKSLERF